MAPSERAAHRLSQYVQESNALNRVIQINLLSEDEENVPKLPKSTGSNGFFQKRLKTSVGNSFGRSINLKKISSLELPPFPLEFQLYKTSHSPHEASSISPQLIKLIKPVVKTLNQSHCVREIAPLAKLIKETYSEINLECLKKLNNLICDRSIGISAPTKHKFSSILNDIEVNLSSNQPILWILTGPPGVGKTKLVENISEALDLRLITIDSTQSPRNSKAFETLQTTLSHSAPRSFSQFFSTPEKEGTKKKQKVAVIFDEVEIAFESDRGFWSALSSFLQSPAAKTVPIFITSNVSIDFLDKIIKFPEHVRFTCIDDEGDFRKLTNNSDFISRLHRIDTSIEYEQLALTTGYHAKPDNVIDVTVDDEDMEIGNTNDSAPLIKEALRWDNLLENIQTGSTDIDAFSYAESASFADILLSISETSVKMNLDYTENLHSEFFTCDAIDIPITSNTLLYSNIPEIYSHMPETTAVARELLEKTIYSFTRNLKSETAINNKVEYWKDLSKRLAERFFDYTKSLQSPQTWMTELTNHIIEIETDNYLETFSRNRGRRKRAYYRYIGEEILNEILRLRCQDSSSNKK